jgi:hypothetical protein
MSLIPDTMKVTSRVRDRCRNARLQPGLAIAIQRHDYEPAHSVSGGHVFDDLGVRPVSNNAGTYRAVCTILGLAAKEPLEIVLTVRLPDDSAAGNGGQPS